MIDDASQMSFVDDHDTVAHADDFRQFRRNHDDRYALGGQFIHQVIDILFRTDIDAAGRFIQDEQLRMHAHPLRDDDLLLVAAGESARRKLDGLCLDAELVR